MIEERVFGSSTFDVVDTPWRMPREQRARRTHAMGTHLVLVDIVDARIWMFDPRPTMGKAVCIPVSVKPAHPFRRTHVRLELHCGQLSV